MQTYRVEAYNTAQESENKIHDDAVAKRFGFTGGLVPGVDVYAYMTQPPVARWGRAWLERGTADCRFDRPVYDGKFADVVPTADGDGMTLHVTSEGLACATGRADFPAAEVAPPLSAFPERAPPAERPSASEASLPVGAFFGMTPVLYDEELATKYLRDLRETLPLYAAEKIVHPGFILRMGNWVLSANVKLGPWIHVGSQVRHFATGSVGDIIEGRAQVAANYAHKGHKFVELDVLVLANGQKPLARIRHTAIYLPRQVAEAA